MLSNAPTFEVLARATEQRVIGFSGQNLANTAWAFAKAGRSSVLSGHWKATGHFFRKFIWKILYKNLDLEGGGTRAWERGLPLYHPPLRSRFVYRIFHKNFPKNCLVAFQWPGCCSRSWPGLRSSGWMTAMCGTWPISHGRLRRQVSQMLNCLTS